MWTNLQLGTRSRSRRRTFKTTTRMPGPGVRIQVRVASGEAGGPEVVEEEEAGEVEEAGALLAHRLAKNPLLLLLLHLAKKQAREGRENQGDSKTLMEKTELKLERIENLTVLSDKKAKKVNPEEEEAEVAVDVEEVVMLKVEKLKEAQEKQLVEAE